MALEKGLSENIGNRQHVKKKNVNGNHTKGKEAPDG